MAIRLKIEKTDRILFCSSKWWGDPDMPEGMQYPTVTVSEDGETYDYPLTFLCQINCEDIAPLDTEGRLPKEGMLYFFAAIDKWAGYDSPTTNDKGEWSKGHFVVKYAKSINFETFQSCIMVGEDDMPLTEPELGITFEECGDNDSGIKLLCSSLNEGLALKYPGMTGLMHLENNEALTLDFGEGCSLDLLMKDSDLKFGNWKKTISYFSSL
jgi:hypothetical protein